MSKLLVFTRFPTPGRTKTRLIPALGPEGAARLQMVMTEAALSAARTIRDTSEVEIQVRFDGGDVISMRAAFGDDLDYVPQGDGDLGARLTRAFADQDGPTLVIGADCPELNADYLAEACDRLARTDVVLGPARDGGYVLLGLQRPEPRIFEHIPWSTPDVASTTLERAHTLGLTVRTLPTLADIDRPEDLVTHRALLVGLGAELPA